MSNSAPQGKMLVKRSKKTDEEKQSTSLKFSLKFGSNEGGGEEVVLSWEERPQASKQKQKTEPKAKGSVEKAEKEKKKESSVSEKARESQMMMRALSSSLTRQESQETPCSRQEKSEDIPRPEATRQTSSEKASQMYSFSGNFWEHRWVCFPNVIDHNADIWVQRWVRMPNAERLEGVSDRFRQNFLQRKPETLKQYECKQQNCGKTFFDHSSLKKHLLVHGERMFICPVEDCGKKFLDNSKLRRHQLVHTGEKKYKCPICDKNFSLDFNLKTHMRTHTGEKPYVCHHPNCDKKFTQASNLAAHEKTHNDSFGDAFVSHQASLILQENKPKENGSSAKQGLEAKEGSSKE